MLLMLFFVTPYLWYQMHSEMCTPIVRHCISSISLDFYFNQQSGGIPRILRNLKLFIFLLIAVLLVFEPRYSVVHDVSIEIGVYL